MLLESNVPKEVSASITEILGSGINTTIRRLVKVETRSDKQEQKVLVLSDHKIHIFSTKVPAKEEFSIHFLNLQGIESKDIKLTFKYEGKKLVLYAIDNPSEIDKVVFQIADSLAQVFPHMAMEKLTGPLDISPPDRMKNVSEQLKNKTLHRELTPCGNFTAQYKCMCDLHGLPYLEEVSWDVDTIYLSQNCKWLILNEFDHLDSKFLTPVISAVTHNTWFTTLCASNVKLTQEAINEYANVLKSNTTIEHVRFRNSQIKSDAVQKIANALYANIKDTVVNNFDFLGNAIEDKGLQALCPVIAKLPKGLVNLNLSKCRIQAAGVNKLSEALCSNPQIPTTLTTLDLSGNTFKDDITNLHNFLAQPNALTSLNLSGTECALDNIFGALLRGCSNNLAHLDLSGNPFSNKRAGRQTDVMVPVSWKQFFASSVALQSVSVAKSRLPLDAIKNLLLGINSNENLKNVSVNLSDTALGGAGAQLLETCMGENVNITELDISDNDLNTDLMKILQKLTKNNHLKKLSIGRNFQNLRIKHIPVVLEAVVDLLNADDSALESLSVADSKLKGDTVIIINALGGNASLVELDISGNGMGDYGARMLAKALAINSKLQTVIWDKNGISPQGYKDISLALRRNFTLRKMPTPIQDVTNALRINQEKTQQSLHKIEEYLRRNNSPRKYGSEQAYRLQQGFLLSTTQQAIDKYIVSILDSISDLEKGELSEEVEADIETARKLMKDAENCRQLLLQLQKIGQKCEEAGNDTEVKLRHMSVDLQHQLTKQIKNTVSHMCRCAEGKCLSIMEDDAVIDKLKQGCEDKSSLPKDFCKTILMEQVGTEVYNKMSEVNVAVASHISEELIELLIESLDSANTDLENHKSSESKLDKEARTSILRVKEKEEEVKTEPSVHRKSVYSRKLRPVSTVASEQSSPQETDLDGFVFVNSDDGTDNDESKDERVVSEDKLPVLSAKVGTIPDKPARSSLHLDTPTKSEQQGQPSPTPSPRNSLQGLGVQTSRVTPPKPPPPVVVKKSGGHSPTSKYILQGGGDRFKPSPESKTSIDGPDKPRPAPRRRHVKPGEKDSSLNRISEMSVSEESSTKTEKMTKRESSSSRDSLLSTGSMDDSVSGELKEIDEGKRTDLVAKTSVIEQVTIKQKEYVQKSISPKKAAPPVPKSPDSKLDENSSDEEEKEDKSTGDDLTDTTTDTGSVDSLLDESPPVDKGKAKEKEKTPKFSKSLPKEKSKDTTSKPETRSKSNKTQTKTSVSDFDKVTPTSEKLGNLEFSRPKRAKTRPVMRGKVNIKSENEVIEDVEAGISDFYEVKSVTKQHVVPSESVKQKEQQMNVANATTDEKSRTKKRALIPPGVRGISSGISDFFKKKDKNIKSPESNKEKSSMKSEVRPTSKENSPVTDAPRPTSMDKEPEQKQGKEEDQKLEDTKPPDRPAGPRLPPGARPMPFMGGGGGAALLKEVQSKRATVMRTDDKKEASPGKDSAKPPAPTRPPSLYPKLPSENMTKPSPTQRPPSASDDTKPGEVKPLPEKPPPPTRPKPKPIHQPAPARPDVGPSRTSTMPHGKSAKHPAPSIPSTATRGYSEPDDDPKPSDSSDKPKERDPVRRRSSIKDRIAMLDANSNEKATGGTTPEKGSPKTKPRPLSTNLLKESQDKNVDDSANIECRPKSQELENRPKSMLPGSALNAELLAKGGLFKKKSEGSSMKKVSEAGDEKHETSSENGNGDNTEISEKDNANKEIYL